MNREELEQANRVIQRAVQDRRFRIRYKTQKLSLPGRKPIRVSFYEPPALNAYLTPAMREIDRLLPGARVGYSRNATLEVPWYHPHADLVVGHELGHLATPTSHDEPFFGWGLFSVSSHQAQVRDEAAAWRWIVKRWRKAGRRLTSAERKLIARAIGTYLRAYWAYRVNEAAALTKPERIRTLSTPWMAKSGWEWKTPAKRKKAAKQKILKWRYF